MGDADIGLIGLGVMGSNLALNIAEKGHRIAVFNRTPARTDAFVENAGALRDRITPCHSIAELAAAIRPPRPIIVLVQAGKPVDEQIALLRPVLSERDIIIDAGNANFRDTVRRFAELSGSGLTFIGMGISGGEEGARHGPSIMVGGTREFLRARRERADRDRRAIRGRTLLRLARRRRRRAFRQDHPQRHRICRHADDRRDLRRAARRARHGAQGDRRGFRRVEQGPAQLISDRDHGGGACRRRPQDRQAGRRDHPRPCRPEGHWPLVGDRGADTRHTGNRDRGGGRRARALVDEGRAARGREGLRWHRPHQCRAPTPCAAISSWRCSPARSPPMRKALPSWTARRRNSAGACRSPRSPRSGAPAASSARSSSAPLPRPSAAARPLPIC